jgi:hypothetical protein
MTRNIFNSILISVLFFSCSVPVVNSLRQTKKIDVDGVAGEWNLPLRFYDIESRLQYVFSNDDKNLYLCIRATDEECQSKILRTGLQVWIDTLGKNKPQVGLLFPMAITDRKSNLSQLENNPGSNVEVSVLKKSFLGEHLQEMFLSGFKAPIGGVTPIQNDYGIQVKVNWDKDNILVYEALIPIKTFYRESIKSMDSSKALGLSIVLNPLPKPQAAGDTYDAGAANMPGINGANGARAGVASMRGGSTGPKGYLYEKSTVKLKIKLVRE